MRGRFSLSPQSPPVEGEEAHDCVSTYTVMPSSRSRITVRICATRFFALLISFTLASCMVAALNRRFMSSRRVSYSSVARSSADIALMSSIAIFYLYRRSGAGRNPEDGSGGRAYHPHSSPLPSRERWQDYFSLLDYAACLVTIFVAIGSFDDASRRASFAVSSGTPAISNITLPGLTTATQ